MPEHKKPIDSSSPAESLEKYNGYLTVIRQVRQISGYEGEKNEMESKGCFYFYRKLGKTTRVIRLEFKGGHRLGMGVADVDSNEIPEDLNEVEFVKVKPPGDSEFWITDKAHQVASETKERLKDTEQTKTDNNGNYS